MAWCAGALDCLPWVGGAPGGRGYKAVSTVNDDECVEQSTTWADGSTLHLDGTVSAELLRENQSQDTHDVSTVSNLDDKTEAWLSGACAALDDITASPLSAGSRSDRSSLSAEIAAALNSGVSRVISAVSTTSSISDSPVVETSSSRPAPSPCFSSHPSRLKQARPMVERSFGMDRTNSLATSDSSGRDSSIAVSKQSKCHHQHTQQQRSQRQHANASPRASKIAPPPSSPATE